MNKQNDALYPGLAKQLEELKERIAARDTGEFLPYMCDPVVMKDELLDLKNQLREYKEKIDFPPDSILVVGKDGMMKVGEIPAAVHGFCSLNCPFILTNTPENWPSCKLGLHGGCIGSTYGPRPVPGPNCPAWKEK